jgi:STE24 endopeptidase
MTLAESTSSNSDDSPEARRYNRTQRWLGIADFVIGSVFLVLLLITGWSGWLRDLALRRGFQNYTLAVFLYLFFLLLISKVLGLGLDYYGFRLERRFQLSTQKLRSWLWDEAKGFLVELVMATIVVELLYFMIRQSPQHWWLITWALFMGLFILLAQLAPVVLFPIFYKFEPLDNEDLRRRLVQLGERAGTRVRGVYRWKLSEKSKKANAALTGLGSTRRIILADTLLDNYAPEEIEAVLEEHSGAGGNYLARFLDSEFCAALCGRSSYVRGAFRFCQPTLAGYYSDGALTPANASFECLLALQRAASRSLRF